MTEHGEDQARIVPLEFHYPENLVSRYATNFVIQHTPHEFVLSFFEARPPAILGSIEEREAQWKSVRGVPADCVGRVVIAPARMKALVRILQENLNTFERSVGSVEEDKDAV